MKPNIEFLYEQLRKETDGGSESMGHNDAIQAIRIWRDAYYAQKYPQPEQEPVALAEQLARSHAKFLFKAPQPQHPAEWIGLTDEERQSVCQVGPVYAPDGVVTRKPLEYRNELQGVALMAVRWAEAILREKNT